MLFSTFFLGLSSSYLGTVTPSMLNITATKISIENNKRAAINYAIGVSLIVVLQAYFALFILKALHLNTFILESIQIISVAIFSILSVFFYYKARNNNLHSSAQKTSKKSFITGLGLALLNMFAIPFYYGIGSFFNMQGWLHLDEISIFIFVIGSGLGTYLLLYNYIFLAEKIKSRLTSLTQYINYFLSLFTGVIAIVSFIKIL